MLSKFELIKELTNIRKTIGSIVFEASVIQSELYEMMAEVLLDKLGDDGILYHQLKDKQHRLDIVFSNFNEPVNKITKRWG